MNEAVGRARAILAEGGGLDEALAVVDTVALGAIAWIKAAREVTGFSLVDTMRLREDYGRTPLGHLRAPQLALLIATERVADPTRLVHDWFRRALVLREPAVTVFRGSGRSEGGIQSRLGYHADRGPKPGRLGRAGGEYDEIRVGLHGLAAADHVLGRRLTVDDLGHDFLVCRFDLA